MATLTEDETFALAEALTVPFLKKFESFVDCGSKLSLPVFWRLPERFAGFPPSSRSSSSSSSR